MLKTPTKDSKDTTKKPQKGIKRPKRRKKFNKYILMCSPFPRNTAI